MLPGGIRVVTAAAWGGKEANLLALATPAGRVELIRFPQAEVVEVIERGQPVTACEFSRDGRLLALGGQTTRLWDIVRKLFVTPELIHADPVVEIVLNPQASRLAATGTSGRVSVYDIERVVEGDSVNEVLSYVQYEKSDLVRRVRIAGEKAARAGAISFEELALLMRRYNEALAGYTYLSPEAAAATPVAAPPRTLVAPPPDRTAPSPDVSPDAAVRQTDS